MPFLILNMSKEKEKDSSYSFEIFSQEEASAVNQFFGINHGGVLDAYNFPRSVCLGNLWKEVSPILDEHPSDRELYIGWDFVEGRLEVEEVVEGLKREEIIKQHPSVDNAFVIALGMVTHRPHLVNFHTHVLDPNHALARDRGKRLSEATPRSDFDDLSGLIMRPSSYVDVILDTKLRNQSIVGRALVALKTSKSWLISDDNYQSKDSYLAFEMYRAQLRGISRSRLRKASRFSSHRVSEMTEMLRRDDHWFNFTGLAIYRGLLHSNPEHRSSAFRWDVFHNRLVSIRKKRWGIF